MATKYAKYAATSRDRALERVGSSYPAGWCLKFCLVELYGIGGIGDWDGDGAADAEDYAKAAKAQGNLHPIDDPKTVPAGALVLYTGGSHDNGHAAYSLGKGEIVSTDLPKNGKVGRVPLTDPVTKWRHQLAGYVLIAPTGEHLVKAPKKPKATTYRVTARSGLRGRTAPTLLSRTAVVVPYGGTVEVLETVPGGSGLTWAKATDGLYYALRYLKATA